MFGISHRTLAGFTLLATVCAISSTANAQFFGHPYYGGYNPCGPAPVVSAAPVYQTAAAVSDCPCMKPVTETVYKDVDVVQYKSVQKPTKVAKLVTVMEEREVVTYKTVNEQRTVSVPSYVTQTVNECRQVTRNQSYWRTAYQPVPKMSPCNYDGRPGLVGELNRLGYAFRNSITPNVVARREYVPNVVAYNVPVQRTVQIPTTRQVTYTVARQVPVTTVQKVPVQKTVWEDSTVTVQVPYTVRKRVAMGIRTRMVYTGDAGSTTALAPTPAATASGSQPTKSAEVTKGVLKNNSNRNGQEVPIKTPIYRRNPEPTPAPQQQVIEPKRGPVATQPVTSPSAVRVATWKATTRSATPKSVQAGPKLFAQK